MGVFQGFILTDQWDDRSNGHTIRYYGLSPQGPFEIIITNESPIFFIERSANLPKAIACKERKELNLKTFTNHPVDALYFSTQRELLEAKDFLAETGVRTFESDIRPSERFLMERFINGSVEIQGEPVEEKGLLVFKNPQLRQGNYRPSLKVCSLDIETGIRGELYSIGYHLTGEGIEEIKRVLMVGNPGDEVSKGLSFFRTEKELLICFFKEFLEFDPDIIIGWHVIGFDLRFIEKKCRQYGVRFTLGRRGVESQILEKKNGNAYARIEGRVVIDGPPTMRGAFYRFENFKLDTVAHEILGTGKDIGAQTSKEKVAEIERRFREDKEALAKYNILDCVLVTDIYKKTELLDLCISRVIISGMLLDRIGASVAAFDHFFLPRVHRLGHVASNTIDIQRDVQAAGGYVLEPEMGLHEHVLVLDFKSLYPCIINTFKIDPISRVKAEADPVNTPANVQFSRSEHILPDFIVELLEERRRAKQSGDQHLSQAIKILMNSFYGVMGSSGSRFYHADLPTAITGTGQWILLEAIDYLRGEGYQVVYGDTDSVFVVLKEGEKHKASERGASLASEVNTYLERKLKAEFQVESALDIEFEKHYTKFFLPPARNGQGGAKKRYVGLLSTKAEPELQFAGMEYVRSDWTKMAKKFQFEIFRRLFNGDDIEEWVKSFVQDVKDRKYDNDLVYRKRLTKDAKLYTKNIPPHVRAALQLEEANEVDDETGIRLKEVYYVMTRRGPVPIQLEHKDIDHQHYIDKQIKPLADNVLFIFNKNFDDLVTGDQLSLF